MAIHPTAIIESRARLGQNVTVGPFAYIASHTQIGDGCHIGPHTTILPYTTLGEGCQVHAGAVLGDLPQDLAFTGVISYVSIGQRCVLREGVTIHRGTQANSITQVGEGCFLMANSHVAHNAVLGNQVIMANGALVGGYAHIDDRAFISGNCMIHQFTRVGRLAMLSGGCAIQKDVPPFCMTQSSTSNTLLGLNVVGLRRAGVDSADRQEIKAAFKLLFCSGRALPTALRELETSSQSPYVLEMCRFIQASTRGVSKAVRPRHHRAEPPENANEMVESSLSEQALKGEKKRLSF